jgi:D-alanyl-lipoteichoic acid acyltransferase DltB (MBOAT superfamily)
VTAGPIILQKDILPQLAEDRAATFDSARIAVALTVFGIGLFKKLILADNIAPFADGVFDSAAAGLPVGAALAWIGALAYTLQLYFDFSAYSDMALGIGYLFGIKLPLNFNAPLKACSITDFWRRWHITMTRFFTNYLHAPIALPLTRHALRRSYGRTTRFLVATALPVIATFVLAGLWHGAGWTFVVFGLIHGLALAVNHGWREARLASPPPAAAWLLTMAVVVTGLVFFRAADVPTALAMLASMAGMGPAALPATPDLAWVAANASRALVWIGVLGAIALACPHTQQLMGRHWFSSDPKPEGERAWPQWLLWRPTFGWSVVGAILIAAALGSITGHSGFLYYQF